ncbi:MAG: DnaJ family molecular chaperone [Gaiellaceae bacterium]
MSAGAYAVLGIDGSADRYALRRAYRELVRSVHPDAGGTGDPTRLASIQTAYRELSGVVPATPRPRPRRSVLVDVYA